MSQGEAVALAAILLLALLLRIWGLEQNGWGAEYYTAAVRSMALSWHNFFYVAFDPAGFISVDKPPVALWIQALSVELFGFQPLSLLMPQVAEGVASVWILFQIVRRRSNAPAALLAAFFFAVSPISVAVNRTNNTDSCLVMVLLLAAWVMMKAAEEGNRRQLFLAMALVGIAFNVKMLAAYIVLPVFFLAYFLGAPLPWRRRVPDVVLAIAVLVACSAPWMLTVELTPPENRPFVGSSMQNSVLDLTLGHNAISRFVRSAQRLDARPAPPQVEADAGAGGAAETRARGVVSRLFVSAPAGPLRLFSGQLAAQTLWLLPLAVFAFAWGGTKDDTRVPSHPARLALSFWFAWILIYALVYGYAGGIIHYYYLSTMAPAVAALAGIGLAGLWDRARQGKSGAVIFAGILMLTAVWQLYIQSSALDWSPGALLNWPGDTLDWLHAALVSGTLIAAALLLAMQFRIGAALGIAALLVVPIAWALSSVLLAGQGVLPSADLYRLVSVTRAADARALNRFGRTLDTSKLVAFLKGNRSGERFLLATSTTQLAAPIIIDTGESVMARGGFHGLDPAVSPQTLAGMVDVKQLRFAMLGDVPAISRRMGADAAGKPVADWIRARGKLVAPIFWRAPGSRSNAELWDLRPEAGLPLVPAE